MKQSFFLLFLILTGCSPAPDNLSPTSPDNESAEQVPAESPKIYSNDRFRNVTVSKTDGNTFRIKGEGQIFEASFSWVVEDGHHELKKGFEMTDAGAPEWGRFDFTIEVAKKKENSSLTLIIFEISAEDGRRVHELIVPLN